MGVSGSDRVRGEEERGGAGAIGWGADSPGPRCSPNLIAGPTTSSPRRCLPAAPTHTHTQVDAHLRFFERGFQLFSGVEPYLQHALSVRCLLQC